MSNFERTYPDILKSIEKLDPHGQKKAFAEVLSSRDAVDFINSCYTYRGEPGIGLAKFGNFLSAVAQNLKSDPFIMSVFESDATKHLLSYDTKIYWLFLIARGASDPYKGQVLKCGLNCTTMDHKRFLTKGLIWELGSNIQSRYQFDRDPTITDEARIKIASVLIHFVQKHAPVEDHGIEAAYITPLLELEGSLAVTLGMALSNGTRERKKLPPISFSQITSQFNQAEIGWQFRPINTVAEQNNFNAALPGNDNLFIRVIKKIGNKEIHAVVGDKTEKINISIESNHS